MIIKQSGEGGCLSQRKAERKEHLKAGFSPLLRAELLKRGCFRPCLESRLKERCGFSIESVLIFFFLEQDELIAHVFWDELSTVGRGADGKCLRLLCSRA